METEWRERLLAEREQHEAQIRELRGELETNSNQSNTRTVKRLLRRWKHRYLSSAFKTWYDIIRQDSLYRQDLESSSFRIVVALKKMRHNKILCAWQTWRSYALMCRQKLDSNAELRSHAARSVFRSLKRWRVNMLSRGFETWRDMFCETRSRERSASGIILSCFRRLKRRDLSAAMNKWKEVLVVLRLEHESDRKKRNRIVSMFVRRMIHNKLHAAMSRWRDIVNCESQQSSAIRTCRSSATSEKISLTQNYLPRIK